MIKKIEIERFSLTSSKAFDQVVAAVDAGVGHPDMAEFANSSSQAHSFAEFQAAVEKGLSDIAYCPKTRNAPEMFGNGTAFEPVEKIPGARFVDHKKRGNDS